MSTSSKTIILGAATALLSLSFATPIRAENPAHVRQLLETGFCQGCDLRGADLMGAHLIGADLRDANLENANLANVNLEGADLKGANLAGADLSGAFLNHTELDNTNLDNANLSDADLTLADLTGASLAGTNLNGVRLLQPTVRASQIAPDGSIEDLRGENLSIGRDPSKLMLPMGGPDLEGEFEYTPEYLDSLYEPIEIDRDSQIPGSQNIAPGGDDGVQFNTPQITF